MSFTFSSRFKILMLFTLIIVLAGCVSNQPFKNMGIILPSQPQYVAVNEGRLEYYRFGNGNPVVLITGYASNLGDWDTQFLATLAKQHQVIVFNNRGVAGSQVQSPLYDTQALAHDTDQLIRNLQLQKPTVIGISMGGMIAQQLAVQDPQALSGLVLINTAIAGSKAVLPDAKAQQALTHLPRDLPSRFQTALKLFFPPNARANMSVALITHHFSPPNYDSKVFPDEITLNKQVILMRKWSHDDATAKEIATVTLPVLILNGEADTVIPPINSPILAQNFKHAMLLRYANGGHVMIYQFPQQLAQAINYFIDTRTKA